MPFAFGHLVPAWIVGKISNLSGKSNLTRIEWALLLWGAIFPDIDFLIHWTTNLNAHRYLTHSIFFALVSAIVVYFLATYLKKQWKFFNPRNYALAIFVGICMHLILDMSGHHGIPLLWPLPVWFTLTSINTIAPQIIESFSNYKSMFYGTVLDMAIGVTWLGWFVIRKRIKF